MGPSSRVGRQEAQSLMLRVWMTRALLSRPLSAHGPPPVWEHLPHHEAAQRPLPRQKHLPRHEAAQRPTRQPWRGRSHPPYWAAAPRLSKRLTRLGWTPRAVEPRPSLEGVVVIWA